MRDGAGDGCPHVALTAAVPRAARLTIVRRNGGSKRKAAFRARGRPEIIIRIKIYVTEQRKTAARRTKAWLLPSMCDQTRAPRTRTGCPTRYAAARVRGRPEAEAVLRETHHKSRAAHHGFAVLCTRCALCRVDTIGKRLERETFMHGMHLRRRKHRRCLFLSSGTMICHFRRRGSRFLRGALSSRRSGQGFAGARRRYARAAGCTVCRLAGRVPAGISPITIRGDMPKRAEVCSCIGEDYGRASPGV